MANCDQVSCVDCSTGILYGLIEVMTEQKLKLLDVCAKDMDGKELDNPRVLDWFRVCATHDNEDDIPVLFHQHAAELNALLGDHDSPANPWIMAVTHTIRPKVFPFVTYAPQILAELKQGTSLHGLVHNVGSSMCALRSLGDSLTDEEKQTESPQVPDCQALYEAYKKKNSLSPVLSNGEWSDATRTVNELYTRGRS